MQTIEEISQALSTMDKKEITKFFKEILTLSEITTLSKRWRIIKMLASKDYTQREIAEKLGVSLCKVTRGSKILKTPNAMTKKIIEREQNEHKFTKNN